MRAQHKEPGKDANRDDDALREPLDARPQEATGCISSPPSGFSPLRHVLTGALHSSAAGNYINDQLGNDRNVFGTCFSAELPGEKKIP